MSEKKVTSAMGELGFERITRDLSPDSVIFTGESNSRRSSVFSSSSASASVDRCSFASSDASPHLAGPEISSGPNSDPNKAKLYMNNSILNKKADISQVVKDDHYLKEGFDPNETVHSARSSFSQALKECQDRRSRSVALYRKQDRQRPASLDLNNHHVNSATSPRFGAMKKGSIANRRTGTVLSPVTPNHGHNSVTTHKGWSSERVPLHNNASRRNTNASLFPLSNGRTLPSKWEDAERWIISPNAGDGAIRSSVQQPHRRPKSKSGPLGPPSFAYNHHHNNTSLYSPAVPMFEGGGVGTVNDVFSVRSSLGSSGAVGAFGAKLDPYMARSISIHGCTEMISQSTYAGHQGDVTDSDKDASTNISRVVSRRDMATQMSPDGSSISSSLSRLSFSLITPSAIPITELESIQFPKSDVRDVQIDESVTMTKWSKKYKSGFPVKVSENLNDWRRKSLEAQSSAWEVTDAAKSFSKIKREEAKISAWENLQKAKAEAAIKKLEMKLEKKRSSKMDKIMNKLKSAQNKAQKMRSWMLTNQSSQVTRTSPKVIPFRPTRHISSLSGCWCPAF